MDGVRRNKMKKSKECKNTATFVVCIARNERYWVCSKHLADEILRLKKKGHGVLVQMDCSEYAPCCYERRPMTDEERELYDLMNSAGRALNAAIKADRKVRIRRKLIKILKD